MHTHVILEHKEAETSQPKTKATRQKDLKNICSCHSELCQVTECCQHSIGRIFPGPFLILLLLTTKHALGSWQRETSFLT